MPDPNTEATPSEVAESHLAAVMRERDEWKGACMVADDNALEWLEGKDAAEAALSEAQAELIRLRAESNESMSYEVLEARLVIAEAELERLREALERIIIVEDRGAAWNIARQALQEQSE